MFPPEKNKELINCSNYFIEELDNLKKLKVIVVLGRVAFENLLKIYKKNTFGWILYYRKFL